MLDALREIAALCRENAWNAVFVTPPYPDVYTQCYSTEILGCFQDLMTSLSAQTGVPGWTIPGTLTFQVSIPISRTSTT